MDVFIPELKALCRKLSFCILFLCFNELLFIIKQLSVELFFVFIKDRLTHFLLTQNGLSGKVTGINSWHRRKWRGLFKWVKFAHVLHGEFLNCNLYLNWVTTVQCLNFLFVKNKKILFLKNKKFLLFLKKLRHRTYILVHFKSLSSVSIIYAHEHLSKMA